MNDARSPLLDWNSLRAFAVMSLPVWVLDVEHGRNLWANEAGLALWGVSSIEALQAQDFSWRTETSRVRLDALLEMTRDGRIHDDYWTVYPPGTPVTFEGRFCGITLADGRMGLLVQARVAGEREFPGEMKRRVESYRHSPAPISLHRPDGSTLVRNPAAVRLFGPLPDGSNDDLALQLGGPDVAREVRQTMQHKPHHRRRISLETQIGPRWFDVELRSIPDPLTGERSVLFSAQDVTEAQVAGQRLAAENRVMEMISTGRPLADVLAALATEIEKLNPGMLCTVLLLDADGIHVRQVAAPNVPRIFGESLLGAAIGPRAGSCGTAMYRGEPVITFDIAADPLWEDYRALALPLGLRACWSVPIMSASGRAVGSFAAYYPRPCMPDEQQLELLETGRHIAGIAVERDRAMQALGARSEQLQMVMDAMPFSIAYADSNFRYVAVNRRFEELFKRRREDVIGRHTWEIIGQELFDNIKPYMDQLMEGREVKYERDQRDENGRISQYEVHYLPQLGDDGAVIGHFGILHDITERKRDEALLQFLANHDQLTELPNRNRFMQRLNEALSRASRYRHSLALLFIDLDRFKNVNDTLGHESGDTLLIAVSARFREILRETDTLARLGGDEFTVVLEEIEDTGRAAATAQRLLGVLAQPFHVQGHELFVGASIGISVYPDDGTDATTLLRNADIAMYRAKDMGRNAFQFFSHEATASSLERLRLENSLRHALEREEFVLHYQPIIDLEHSRIVGMESLVRWNHPELGMVSPATFIPVAEETGMIMAIGDWVLGAACRQARRLHDLGHIDLRVAVNLSARQFRRRDLAQSIADTLSSTGLRPSCLELEVTESSVMENPEVAVRTLHALKEMGVHLSIDDFGTGYSSLSQLKRLPIDALKIDQSFVRDIPGDEDNATIASAIIAMGHRLRLTLVAEGVETKEQLAFLRERGCQRGQGFLFSRPVPASEIATLLERGFYALIDK